ncbi:membrane protein [Nocardioides caricicola]
MWVVAGAVLVVMGLVWTLQGFDVIEGSAMSGTTTWSVIGPVVVVIGAALVWVGLRGRKS